MHLNFFRLQQLKQSSKKETKNEGRKKLREERRKRRREGMGKNHVCFSSKSSKSSLVDQLVKNLPDNAGDAREAGYIPGSERPSGEGNGHLL